MHTCTQALINLIFVTNRKTVGECGRPRFHFGLTTFTSAWSLSWCILIFARVIEFHFLYKCSFLSSRAHLGSNYNNRLELTLIHCRVCFSDLFTRTYSTLRLFRFDIFHPASSCYQSITSQTSLLPFLATKEDKRHLSDCKLLTHPLNCMSKLRFMP